MDQSFWEERWAKREIGFHRAAPNALLVAHGGFLDGATRVYVPLCGKSIDLVYLRGLGHEVVGCEFVHQAVVEFFADQGVTPAQSDRPPFKAFSHEGLTLLEGDAFAIAPEHTGGPIDAVYDRASLVAVAPADRERLVETFRRLLPPGGRLLLVTFEYDQTKAPGPPWSVDRGEVARLFGAWCEVRELESRAEPVSPRLASAGISAVTEHLFGITVR